MLPSPVFKVRTSNEAILAFDRWVAQYRTEFKDPSIKYGEAFEELLRRVGQLPQKERPVGQVFR